MVLQINAGKLRMLFEIKIRSIGNALKLRPAKRELVLDVEGRFCVVRQLFAFVCMEPKFASANSQLGVILLPLL